MPPIEYDEQRVLAQAGVFRKMAQSICPTPTDAVIALMMASMAITFETRDDGRTIDEGEEVLRIVFEQVLSPMKIAAQQTEQDEKDQMALLDLNRPGWREMRYPNGGQMFSTNGYLLNEDGELIS